MVTELGTKVHFLVEICAALGAEEGNYCSVRSRCGPGRALGTSLTPSPLCKPQSTPGGMEIPAHFTVEQ